MGTWVHPGTGCEPWASGSTAVAALEEVTRWNAGRLEGIREHAASIARLSWESPAGALFTSYLGERCAELGLVVELLQAAARELDECGRLVRDAEVLSLMQGAG